MFLAPLPFPATRAERLARYAEVRQTLEALLEGDDDVVSAMATVACELHHGFAWFHWTGFYRTIAPGLLAVGPYQGGHGCTRIPYDQGVCGAAARSGQAQVVPDVHRFPGHIACASSTLSELVVPVFDAQGVVIGVLDIDSDEPAAFDDVDAAQVASIAAMLTRFERL